MPMDMTLGRGRCSDCGYALSFGACERFDASFLAVLHSPVPDPGSQTGVTSRPHLRSSAVNVAMHHALTSAHITDQVGYPNVCAVRDEEAAGSNPATPTQKPQVTHYEVACSSRNSLLPMSDFGSQTRIGDLFAGNLSTAAESTVLLNYRAIAGVWHLRGPCGIP